MMTKKQFKEIAKILKDCNRLEYFRNPRTFRLVVDNLADYLETENINFDYDKFIEAVK